MKKTLLLLLIPTYFGFSSTIPAHGAPIAKPKTKVAPQVWKTATSAQRAQATSSIRAQLDAFKRNNWEKAATYQSQGLRRNFGTTAQFRSVIERNYPQFAKYKAVTFKEALALGDQVQIQVLLTGADGVKLRAIYLMVKERGAYRVAGVQGGNSGIGRPGVNRTPADYV